MGKTLFDPNGERCDGNDGRGGSMAGRGGGWLAKCSIVSNAGCGGLAVRGGDDLGGGISSNLTFKDSSILMVSLFRIIYVLLLDAYDEPIVDMEDKVDNSSPQSTPQVLLSFEVYTMPVTHPKEVDKTIGILLEVEPLDHTRLEDLGLNTCNHDIPLRSSEVHSFDEPKPQPKPLANCPTLDVSLGDERGPQPPIKPYSLDSFRMKVVEPLTIHAPPSLHVLSFHPKDMYCYYHLCVDDPKKHYGFKLGLLGYSGSLGVDFLN
nr:ribonuclease H-like domain-containing protein [Tanacetum cinerariifolium]